jgi:FKBP-type peptidyl-prolyl cis-trans isomerase FklB
MKLRLMTTVIAGVLATQAVFAASTAPATSTAPTSLQDQISYTIGVDMGKNLKTQNININPDMLAQGIKDGMAGGQMLMTQQQMDAALKQFQQQMVSKQQQQMQQMSAQNSKDGAAFLAKNKSQAGVVTLPNGLQYKVILAGNGNSPTANDTVTVDYEGSFINGQVFSSTYQQGQPVTFQISQVIPGWQQALKMMKPGAEWMVYIPSNLAYGEQGVGDTIGPNETLVFKIHLLTVNPTQSGATSTTPAMPTTTPTVSTTTSSAPKQ